MQNGSVNGVAHGAPQQVQINPVQAAGFALQFLPRAPHTHAERDAFDVATMFLQAVAGGQALVTPAPPPPAPTPAPVEPPPPPVPS